MSDLTELRKVAIQTVCETRPWRRQQQLNDCSAALPHCYLSAK